MTKIDFSIDTMKEMCEELLVLLQEELISEDLDISLEGHNDYLDIITVEDGEIRSSHSIKYIEIYKHFIENEKERLVNSVAEIILNDESEDTVNPVEYDSDIESSLKALKKQNTESDEMLFSEYFDKR